MSISGCPFEATTKQFCRSRSELTIEQLSVSTSSPTRPTIVRITSATSSVRPIVSAMCSSARSSSVSRVARRTAPAWLGRCEASPPKCTAAVAISGTNRSAVKVSSTPGSTPSPARVASSAVTVSAASSVRSRSPVRTAMQMTARKATWTKAGTRAAASNTPRTSAASARIGQPRVRRCSTVSAGTSSARRAPAIRAAAPIANCGQVAVDDSKTVRVAPMTSQRQGEKAQFRALATRSTGTSRVPGSGAGCTPVVPRGRI